MTHSLRYCCAMCFALISFLLAPPLSAQAQTREAYVSQSADTLTFYYDALRATRTGKSWGIEETKKEDATFPAWAGEFQGYFTTTRVVFDASFRDFRPTTTARWFYEYDRLKQIEGLEYLNTSEVKDMSEMFYRCNWLTSLDLSHFNTQKVTNMRRMFQSCSGLTSLDLSHFDTQNVTDMNAMFLYCSGLTSLDLKHFNTQNVTDMGGMFLDCSRLSSLDLKHFNTQNVTDMSAMFYGCSGLTSLDLKHFNTQNVTDMSFMFYGCKVLTSLDVSNFNTQNVTNMREMFKGCSWRLSSLDLKNFNTQNVTNMREMFKGCSVLTSLDLSHFNTQNVTDMGEMFYGCESLTSLNLSHFNTQNVTDMHEMFSDCSGLTSLDVSHFNTQNVTNMSGMFKGCRRLPSLDVSHFNTQNVTNMSGMFKGCRRLPSLDVSHFDTRKVSGMREMFSGCSGLTSLDVSHFDTQNVTDMCDMFSGCKALTSLDVSHFNTQNVTNMYGVFDGCYYLASLDVSHFNTQNVTDMKAMFSDCSGLTSLDVSNFDTQKVTGMWAMFKDCRRLTSLDVSHFDTRKVSGMSEMFSGCSGLTSLDVSHFNTQKVTDMREMFKDCDALTTINSNTAWQCPRSTDMFYGCTKLKGAVRYNENKRDVRMANPETGYFTRSNNGGVEAYVAQSADERTLTFYYDAHRATHTGTTWGIKETKKEGDDTFPAWAGTFEVAESTTTRVVFDTSFRDFRPTTTIRWFYNYRALKQIKGLENLNTSEVKDMGGMFSYCSGLTSLDLKRFNTQNVTNMREMLKGCAGLASLDLKNFNTQNVTNMREMFKGCGRLTSLDLSHFNTRNVTDMGGMFEGCSALTTINSNTAWQCPRSEDMFTGCTQLKGAVPYDENNTDVRMANPKTGYFTRSNDGGLKAYVAQSADKTTLTFYYDDQRATRAGKSWGIEETKTEVYGHGSFPAWAGTYYWPDSITTRVVFDTSFRDFRPTTTRWFSYCKALKQIEGLEHLNTSEVKDMREMFYGCSSLTSLDLSHFNTQKVTNMGMMFYGCSSLTSLDLSHFNTRNVTDMGGMFYGCSGLISLNLSHFNTRNVTDMGGMFYGCSGLISLNLSHFNTQNVKDMRGMFQGCLALTTINNYTEWLCTTSKDMFAGCTKLKGAVAYDENKTDFNMANPETGYFTRSNDGGVEAYVAQSADKTTFTFYYDVQRPTRTGKTWGIEETEKEGDVTFPAWAWTFGEQNYMITRVVFDASFRDFRPTTTARWFYEYHKLKEIEGLEYLNTSEVEDMSGMFFDCYRLDFLDLSHFNTQNVTDMDRMFYSCWDLTTIYCNTAWQCPQSEEMFAGCGQLKGAVAYGQYKTDATMANPETGYFTAKPTAVENVHFGADGAQHIYTLQGKRVRGEWTHLPAGVYVVNGKKTVKL